MKETYKRMIPKLGAPKGYHKDAKGSKSKRRAQQVGAGRNPTEWGEAYLPLEGGNCLGEKSERSDGRLLEDLEH